MANDLDLYSNNGGELQPLAPTADYGTGIDTLTNREIDSYQSHGGSVQVFGVSLPVGTTPAQVQQYLGEIGGIFMADMARLGHPPQITNAAIAWYQNSAMQPVRQEPKRHNYNLHDQAHDALANNFGNAMAKVGASQEFVSNSLWWLGEANKRLGESQGAPAMDGPSSSSASSADLLDQLSDAQHEQVVAINDAAKARTHGYLADLWGQAYQVNLKMVDDYLASLPRHEQEALDVFSSGWIHFLNTKEAVLGLYKQAIGANSLPSGGALASEIEQHEHVMRHDRRRWNSDERLQARYRQLLTLRDGS